jgi:hypothetical protein
MPTGATRLRFGTPEPPTIPIRDGGETNTCNNSVERKIRFSHLRQQGASSRDQGSEALSSRILIGGPCRPPQAQEGAVAGTHSPLPRRFCYFWTASNRIRGSKRGSSRSTSHGKGLFPTRNKSYISFWKGKQKEDKAKASNNKSGCQ